ncbi:MAG: ABC transporter permease, partial [Bradymonadaceae bacterium]
TIFACVVAFISGAVTANINYGLNYYTFIDVGMVGWFDLIIGLTKSIAYGITIPITACQAGLSVFGGSAGVGRATTRAVVNSSLAVVILDFIISGVGLFVLALM